MKYDFNVLERRAGQFLFLMAFGIITVLAIAAVKLFKSARSTR